jgi:hypothetical protein
MPTPDAPGEAASNTAIKAAAPTSILPVAKSTAGVSKPAAVANPATKPAWADRLKFLIPRKKQYS